MDIKMERIDTNYITKRRAELKRQKIRRRKITRLAKVTTVGLVGAMMLTGVASHAIDHAKWAKENPRAELWLIQNEVEFITKKDRELAERKIAEIEEKEQRREQAWRNASEKLVDASN